MHSAPEPRCTNDDSKSFGFLYPPQHNLSECYHQTQYKRTKRCKKRNEYSITMHTASEPRCTHDDSKSFGFLYPPQHNHSGCYHQTQYKRTRRCKKRNESSITMHTTSEPRCTHDESKSFGFLYPPQHNHSGCYHQSHYKRTRRCKKRNESSITMHSASEPRCAHDDSKSFGFLYPLQHNHSECYHQSHYKRTTGCTKRNESSITMHTASEPRCTHDDSKSFGFLYPPQHNHSGCYHQTQYKRTRRCKKRNESSITMYSASEPRCTHDDSKSFGFLYPPQHNHSECYHQSHYKRTRRCTKRNETSITMHTASEPRCTHDDSKSFGFVYPPQHNHFECKYNHNTDGPASKI